MAVAVLGWSCGAAPHGRKESQPMAKAQDTSQLQDMAEKAREAGSQVLETAKETGSQVLETADELTSAPIRAGEQIPAKLYLAAVGGSIFASLALFLAGRTQASLFVGLWAPTMLNLALVSKLLQPSQESLTGEETGSRRKGRGRRKR
jgi:hypothetical protein